MLPKDIFQPATDLQHIVIRINFFIFSSMDSQTFPNCQFIQLDRVYVRRHLETKYILLKGRGNNYYYHVLQVIYLHSRLHICIHVSLCLYLSDVTLLQRKHGTFGESAQVLLYGCPKKNLSIGSYRGELVKPQSNVKHPSQSKDYTPAISLN